MLKCTTWSSTCIKCESTCVISEFEKREVLLCVFLLLLLLGEGGGGAIFVYCKLWECILMQ